MAIALVFLSVGNLASGAMTAWLLDIYGWRIGFWLGAVMPLLALPLFLPLHESLPFRVVRNPADARIGPRSARSMRAPASSAAKSSISARSVETERLGPLAMFGPRYRVQTAILWCACLMAMGNIALLANWLPTYFQELGGVPIQTFAKYLMIGFVGGALGTVTVGWLMDRVNPYTLIAGVYVVDALAIGSLGYLPAGTLLFVAGLVVWNFCQTGGQTGINNLATLGYPPEMRSSGIGWAGGAGRLGGIAFPLTGGLALGWSLSLHTLLLVVSMPALAVAVLILLLGVTNARRETGAQPLPA